MIKQLVSQDSPAAAEVIRTGFATVASDFGLTEQNCPKHTSFTNTGTKSFAHLPFAAGYMEKSR